MHSYWFVLNYFLAKEGVKQCVDFDELNRSFLLWINTKMDIESQQEGIRTYILKRKDLSDFKCDPFLKSMYPFVYKGESIPSMKDMMELDPRDLELYQVCVFHYYCQVYVPQNAVLYDQYKKDYPLLCENGIRGYLVFYEFDHYLAKGGNGNLAFARPSNYTLSIPMIESKEQDQIKDFVSTIGDSMVLFEQHSRVVFDHSKLIYDSREGNNATHIMAFNAYCSKNNHFIIKNKSDKEQIEYMQFQHIGQNTTVPEE